MGQHSSAESLLAGVEADSLRVKATALAVQMTEWLQTKDISPLDYLGHEAVSDVVEWCRSARDVLEAVGRG